MERSSMFGTITLSNGIKLEIQQRVKVKSLKDYTVSRIGKQKSIIVRVGDIIEVRHYPPNQLTLVKPSRSANRNFSDIKENVKEGIDFECVSGAEPYPEMKPFKPIFPWELR